MRWLCGAAWAGAALTLASPCLADDSTAELAAGGLVLTRSADIRMAAEDLYISPEIVRVRFAFVNESARPIESVVAFPLPDIDSGRFYEEPIGAVTDDPLNFVGFSATVDGRPLAPQVEQRAVYKGKDVTSILAAAHVPVNVIVGKNADVLRHLSPTQTKALEEAGLGDHGSGDGETPHWTIRTKFWWRQSFPPGKTVVIEHSYHPVTGEFFFVGTYLDAQAGDHYLKTYCIDRSARAEIAARLARSSRPGDDGLMQAFATDYVLRSGDDWKGPIGRFHLTLDKMKPDNLLSLCWRGALRKTGPTTFESTLSDFAPKQDVKMLVLRTMR